MNSSIVASTYDSPSDDDIDIGSPPKLRRETTSDYVHSFTPVPLPPRPQFTFTDDTGITQTPLPSEPRSVVSPMEIEKTCVFCKRNFFTDAAFKTSCPECYDKFKRKCACGRNIPGDAPKFKTSCTQCWMESRKQTHERCPSCTGARALHLRKRKDKPECLDCAKAKSKDTTRNSDRTRDRSRSRDRDRRPFKSSNSRRK